MTERDAGPPRLSPPPHPTETSQNGEGMAYPNPHTCPYCELRFKYHNEVVDHVRHDHPDHAAVVADIEPHELPHD